MSPSVTVEIVLALCLVLTAWVETLEYVRFGAGGGDEGTGIVASIGGGVDGGGVVDSNAVRLTNEDVPIFVFLTPIHGLPHLDMYAAEQVDFVFIIRLQCFPDVRCAMRLPRRS